MTAVVEVVQDEVTYEVALTTRVVAEPEAAALTVAGVEEPAGAVVDAAADGADEPAAGVVVGAAAGEEVARAAQIAWAPARAAVAC